MAQVRVMTWNVENLFLHGDAVGLDTHAALDRKIASLAAVIDAQAPDVLALQVRATCGTFEDRTRIRALPEQVRPAQVRDPVWGRSDCH